jgi:hypothetical protein
VSPRLRSLAGPSLRPPVTAAAALAVLLCTASPSGAAPPAVGGISVAPLTASHRLAFDVRPGERVRARVRVSNTSGTPKHVSLWPTDIDTGGAGGIEFPDRPDPSVARWLRLSARTVDVPAHGTRDVTLTARPPRRFRRGEVYAGIVAVERPARAARLKHVDGVHMRTVVRLGLPVAFRLPGRPTLGVEADGGAFVIDATGTSVDLGLRATGDSRFRRATIDVRLTHDGRTVLHHRNVLADVFPRTSLRYRVPWSASRPAAGAYRLVGVVRPAGAAPARIDLPLTFGAPQARQLQDRTDTAPLPAPGTPAWIVGLVAGLVAVTLACAAALVRTRRRLRPPPVGA